MAAIAWLNSLPSGGTVQINYDWGTLDHTRVNIAAVKQVMRFIGRSDIHIRPSRKIAPGIWFCQISDGSELWLDMLFRKTVVKIDNTTVVIDNW